MSLDEVINPQLTETGSTKEIEKYPKPGESD